MTDRVPSFLEEMKRYIGFSPDDAARLRALAPIVEPHLPALAERFYEEIPRHSDAERVFTGGAAQVARLKLTLQEWARGLFSGTYDEAYANERFRVGFRHVQIALPQRYVIAAMHVVEQFLRDILDGEIADDVERRAAHASLSRVLNLDLNLICETYFEGSLRELRQLNEALDATNRSLEEASRVKNEFLATVSHELRTPLTAIVGFSKLLADDAVPQPDMRREFTRDIHSSALALLSLVDEILDLARLESGRFHVRTTRMDLLNEIRQAVTAVQLEAERKHLSLRTDLPEGLPAVVGDGPRVRQVLTNLLGNAVKFTDRGSIRVHASLTPDGSRVRVSVEDTGIGIAPEAIPLVFEKFRQLDASHTRRHGGVGLGLAISKALLDRMGGSIELRSDGPGRGTVAAIALPVAPGLRPDVPTREQRAGRVALVIGIDSVTRQRVADALGAAGYDVRQAATDDGVRALTAAERVALIGRRRHERSGPLDVDDRARSADRGHARRPNRTGRRDPACQRRARRGIARATGCAGVLIDGRGEAGRHQRAGADPQSGRRTRGRPPDARAGRRRRSARVQVSLADVQRRPVFAAVRARRARRTRDARAAPVRRGSPRPPHAGRVGVRRPPAAEAVQPAVSRADHRAHELSRPGEHGGTAAARLGDRARGAPEDKRGAGSPPLDRVPGRRSESQVKRVLIVEDDAVVAKYLKYVIEQDARYQAVVTESGDDMMTLARDPETVAIMVDVSLRATQLQGRYVDGLELSRALKADPATARAPIIIATAHAMAGDRERFLRESSADAFVPKPITDSGEVLALIDQLVAGRAGR